MGNKKEKHRRQTEIAQKRNQRWLRVGIVVVLLALVVGVGIIGRRNQSTNVPLEAEQPKATPEQLLGQWLRTDGDYVIDITDVDPDGNIEAGYYNPYPINVEEAHAIPEADVFIKLVDQNYPGSTYTLDYNAEYDALTGIYFHAGRQEEFEVVFSRME